MLLRQMSKESGRSRFDLFRDMTRCYSERGCTWKNYGSYGFHLNQDPERRDTFLGQYEVHELIERVNTREAEHLMEDKSMHLAHFAPFIRRQFIDLRTDGLEGLRKMLGSGELLVAKIPVSYCGVCFRAIKTA